MENHILISALCVVAVGCTDGAEGGARRRRGSRATRSRRRSCGIRTWIRARSRRRIGPRPRCRPPSRRRGSACVLALTNLTGATVSVSLRGGSLVVGDDNEEYYTAEEGRFWGNLFLQGDSYASACNGVDQANDDSGTWLALRECAEDDSSSPGTCGFAFAGLFADACGIGEGVEVCDDGDHSATSNFVAAYLIPWRRGASRAGAVARRALALVPRSRAPVGAQCSSIVTPPLPHQPARRDLIAARGLCILRSSVAARIGAVAAPMIMKVCWRPRRRPRFRDSRSIA